MPGRDHQRHCLKQPFVLHILRAASIHFAVQYLAGKRRQPPAVRVRLHHVHVVQQDQGPKRSITFEDRVNIGVPAGVRVDRVGNPGPLEKPMEKLCRSQFVPRRIRSVDAQVLAHQLHCLVLVGRPSDCPEVFIKRGLSEGGKRENDHKQQRAQQLNSTPRPTCSRRVLKITHSLRRPSRGDPKSSGAESASLRGHAPAGSAPSDYIR